VPVSHTCYPSYLGGWEWEECSLRPACTKVYQDPHLH
jgi:hypothetical protein